jgi:hypothetical protein
MIKYINIINPKKLFIKAYEFKIFGYPETAKADKKVFFNKLKQIDQQMCGLIHVKNHGLPITNLLRSCDVIESAENDELLNNNTTSNNVKSAETILLNWLEKGKQMIIYKNCNAKNKAFEKCEHLFTDIDELIKETTENMKYFTKSEYFIYNKCLDKKTKVIIIGDIQGGYHTFLRLLIRFIIYGFLEIKTPFKVKKGHVIILCGDVIDSGGYSLEILYLICQMLNSSNSKEDIRFIYNKGNQTEDKYDNSNGLFEEYKNKYGEISKKEDQNWKSNKLKQFNDFYKKCPIATILNYGSKKIFVCHGGIPLDFNKKCDNSTKPIKLDFSKKFNQIDNKYAMQIMWNDFSMNQEMDSSIRENLPLNNNCTDLLEKFMKINNIDLVIRGHQYSLGNTILFTTKNKTGEKYISVSNEIESDKCDINIILKDGKKPEINPDKTIKGPIAVFDLNKFSDPEQKTYKKIITINTNTGFGRPLSYDSFLLIEDE